MQKNALLVHGASGLGDGPQASELPNPVAALGSVEIGRQAVPSDWFTLVTKGDLERFMPPFQSLTNKQRWDVVAYAISLSASQQEIAEGKALFRSGCSGCHGETGKGDGPMSAGLEQKPADFGDQQKMADKSQTDFFHVINTGLGDVMPAFESEYTDAQRWSLAAYIRSLSFAPVDTQMAAGATAQPTAANVPSTAKPELSVTPTASEAVSLGSITGTIIHGSEAEMDQNLEVVLHGFDQMSVVLTQTTTLAADGTYAFNDLEMPDGRIFLATIDYGGITYGSEVATASAETTIFDLPIEIFETSADASVLSVDRLHFFFDLLDEQTLQVVELYVISNPTQKTIISATEGGPVISFNLPDQAVNLEFQDGVLGERYLATDEGFSDTQPIRPGSGNYQVLFTYELPYAKKLELVRKMQLATNAVVILIPQAGLEIKGENLQDAGTRDVQGTQYRMYNGDSLTPGQELELTISGRMTGENLTNSSSLLIGVGAFGVVLIAAGVWLYQRNKSRTNLSQNGETEPDLPTQEPAETIMDAILTLDDLYQSGDLPEEAYIQRRKELKERLRQVIDD